jgi:hypothetical protein
VADDDAQSATLEEAQRFFYNRDYDRAAVLTQVLCGPPGDLETCELADGSLLVQIKKAFGETGERDKTTAWSRCALCLDSRLRSGGDGPRSSLWPRKA